jgi:predicted transcriptional regulator
MNTLTPNRPGSSPGISVRLSDDLLRRTTEIALQEERSIAAIVRRALARYTQDEQREATQCVVDQ